VPQSFDLHRVLASLHQSRMALQLDTMQLCYLITLRAKSERAGMASLAEDDLVDLYLQVSELFEPDADNRRKRATHASQHRRDRRRLRRVDGAGLVRAGEFTLTRLATAVADFFIEDETLTRESLVVLTRALTSTLGAVLVDARAADSPERWRQDVVEPLRVTVRDLVSGIERRQRGLDAQQEEIRERIGQLLQQDWFGAVDECEDLLNDTSSTLKELGEILLHDRDRLTSLLDDISDTAADAGVGDVVDVVLIVQEELDRVAAWGGDRQRAWSDYYQFVQRFLRDVVRLDPDRALSHRLRYQLAGYLDEPFALVAAFEPSIRLLREDLPRVEQPPVTRPSAEREAPPMVVPVDEGPRTLEQRVDEALDAGCDTLVAVDGAVLPAVPAAERYRVAGRVVDLVAARRRVVSSYERDFTAVGDTGLLIEDWRLERPTKRRRSSR